MTRKRKRNLKKTYPVILLIMSILMGIGYASVNSIILEINGDVSAQSNEGLFITETKYLTDVNADTTKSTIKNTHQTMMNSTIALSNNDINSYISYQITIYNSTNISFSYIKTSFDEEFYDNNDIIFEITNLKVDDTIEPKSYLTFNITFKYKEGAIPSNDNNTLNSYLNFLFLHKLQYLEATGEQYIDTEVIPKYTSTFDMEFSLNDVNQTQAIYGTRTKMDNGIYHNLFLYKDHRNTELLDNKFQLRWDENSTQIFSNNIYLDEDKKIKFTKNIDTVEISSNGSSVTIDNPHTEWEIDSTAYIFNQNQQDTPETRRGLMKLYYLKMYDNGTLIRDYIPVLDREGTACLYDFVTNKYFYNNGTGEFLYSDEYQVLEYLESSGTQYINTKIKPNNNTKAELVMSLNELSANTQSIFGSRKDQVDTTFNMFWYKEQIRWDFDNEILYFENIDADLTKATYFKVDALEAKANEQFFNVKPTGTFNSNYDVYLYAINNSNKLIFPNTGMKVYYFKLYQGEEIILNLIPVKDNSGILCFYDTISKTYFYNDGTGEFIGG